MASASQKKGRSSKSEHVLEKVDHKECIDDTIPLSATIMTYRILPSHVEYTIRVQRGENPENKWEVSHRYNNFDSLNQSLQVSGVGAGLPRKKVFGNQDKQFLNERQQGLQAYLNLIVKDPYIAASLVLKKFLDPENYSQYNHETALRDVSMFFRSNPEWSIIEPLKDIGWRINKYYFLIGSKSNPSEKKILTLINPGTDFFVSERDLESLLKLLVESKHINLLSPISATYNGSVLLVTREYFANGTLRDKIRGTKPNQHYLTNYSAPPSALKTSEIQRYGRQILDVLQFLLEKGFVLGHIHSGNIFIDKEDVCKLADLENCLMGLPVFHRTFLIELRKVQGAENEAVYCFGHLLYEMACGVVLKTPTMESPPARLPQELMSVLESILSPAGVKSLPSINDLASKPFFSGVCGVTGIEKPSMKVPTRLKEVVRSIREKVDIRLQEDQRKIAQSRRMSRAQESMMSEEEIKKRRKKIRKQMTQEAEQQKEPESYYPTSKLKKQLSVPTSQAPTVSPTKSASSTKTSSTKTTSSSSNVPAPPTSQPPQPTPPSTKSSERGALLSSIEGFKKGKLKKTETNDRSAPKL